LAGGLSGSADFVASCARAAEGAPSAPVVAACGDVVTGDDGELQAPSISATTTKPALPRYVRTDISDTVAPDEHTWVRDLGSPGGEAAHGV
jgi:hypothetical protein